MSSLLAVVAGFWVTVSGPVTAQGGITITFPSSNGQTFAAGPDYATDVLGDPWDMRNQQDIALDPAQKSGWNNALAPSNGLLTGVTDGTAGSNVAFLQRPWYMINNPGRTGQRYPLDATKYTKVAWKMLASGAEFPRIYYFHQGIGDPAEVSGNKLYIQPAGAVPVPGNTPWIYVMDMTQSGNVSGATWQATPQILGLSLYPNSANGANTIQLSWMRVTAADTNPAAKIMHITWTGGSGSAAVTVSDGAGTSFPVGSSSTHAFDFNYGVLPPGSYTLNVGGTTRTFVVNGPPAVQLTDPDESGGEDFATTVLGNPWDMADANDYFVNVNIVDHLIVHEVGPNGFRGVSDGTPVGSTPGGVPIGDAQLYFLSKQKTSDGPLIDTNKYHRLTFGLYVNHAFNLQTGSVARVFWGSASNETMPGGTPYTPVTTSKDIITWPGLNNYTLDLATMTTANGGLEPSNATAWTAQNVRHFRIDPFEFANENVEFFYKTVKLAADDATVNGSFTIKFAGSDPENDATTVSLYYDTDQNATNGMTLIASGLPLASGQYVWNTQNVAPGTYNIYAVATDGINTLGHYATGPLKVVAFTPATNPLIALDTPLNGAGARLPFAVSGFAIDRGASSGTGVDSVTVYADRGTANEVLLGSAVYGGPRTDVGAAYGAQFTNSAFNFAVRGVSPGTHTISVLARSTVTGTYNNSATVTVTVLPLLGRNDFDGDVRADMGIYGANGDWTIRTSSSSYSASIFKNWGGAGYAPVPGEYDGDGKSDFGVYRESTGDWSILKSTTGYTTVLSVNWGGPGYKPVIGDYDGDGKTDLGVYNVATGVWYILKSSSGYASTITVSLGGSGYTPVGGQDFDGDGKSDVAVYRAATGTWIVLKSLSNYTTSLSVNWGGVGYTLVPGDYDGDGRADIATYQRSTGTWAVLKSSTEYSTSLTKVWGPGLTPVPGDYDGDLALDMATFDRASGTWAVLRSSSNYTTSFSVGGFGGPTDQPLTSAITIGGSDSTRATDFDLDGKSDLTIYHTASGFWYTLKSSGNYTTSTNANWGGSGYVPVPGDYDGDGKTDYGLYQQSSGNWYILLSGSGYTTSLMKNAGGPGWVAVPGDYDADGKTDLVVYNTSSGLWYGLKSGANYTTTISISWGGTGYTAAPGDFDGDGKVDLSIYQVSSGNWYVLLSGANYTTSLSKSAGGTNYVPVPGDFDGDGKADFAVYNTSTGLWYALKSSSNYTTTLAVNWGGSGYAPIRGDIDGDGKLDLVLYHSASTNWYVLLSGANYTTTLTKSWGGAGYAAVPAFP